MYIANYNRIGKAPASEAMKTESLYAAKAFISEQIMSDYRRLFETTTDKIKLYLLNSEAQDVIRTIKLSSKNEIAVIFAGHCYFILEE